MGSITDDFLAGFGGQSAPAPQPAPQPATQQSDDSQGLNLTAEQDNLMRQGVPIISGIRTAQQQEALKHHQVNGQWFTKEGNPVADNSLHLSGNAIDVDSKRLTDQHRQALDYAGYYQPLPDKDPNHWQKIEPHRIDVVTTASGPGPAESAFNDTFSATPSQAYMIPGANPSTPFLPPAKEEEIPAFDKYVIGPLAAGTSMAINTAITPVANLYGVLKEIVKGEYGTGTGARYAEEAMGGGATPTSPGGQLWTSEFNKAFEESKLAGLGPPEAGMLAHAPSVSQIKSGVRMAAGKEGAPIVPKAPEAVEPQVLRPTQRGTPEAIATPPGTTTPPPEAPISAPEVVATGEIPHGEESPVTAKDYNERLDVLRRTGHQSVRNSAVEGDPMQAATEAQMTRHDEPAGRSAAEQFAHERDTLHNYTNNMVDEVGGTQGMDESSLHQRGKTIAKPFDMLRDWFESAVGNLYKEADQAAGQIPMTDLPSVKNLLKDPTFQNTAMAGGQDKLVGAIGGQLKHFIETNEGNLTVANAEQFRKWLNTIWSPDNSSIIGQVKNALDQDVFSHAGGDVYQKARDLHQLKIRTLDDPKGIAKLFETDPNNPVNRTTPFNKIPDALVRLDPDQFEHIVRTLKEMPPELQPQVQAALGEIKGHFLNNISDNGAFINGTPTKFWSFKKVNKFFQDNTEKMPMVFSPEEMERVKDIQRAGNINSVDASYPGAPAASANAVKSGLMSRWLTKLTTAAGGAAGSAIGSVFGPAGSVAGAGAGASAGESFGVSRAEKAAKKKFEQNLTKIQDIGK